MHGRPSLIVASVAVALLQVACSPAPEQERAALCEDLVNLAETVSQLAAPPDDATVGDLRGATEKLGPTIGQAEDAQVVPETQRVAFRAAHEAVLEALEGTGDDTTVSDVPPELLSPIDELVARYEAVVASLGCDDVPP